MSNCEHLPKLAALEAESLLSPKSVNAYRLRQGTAAMSVSMVAGLVCWFTWIGCRHSDEQIDQAIMGFALGAVFLLAAVRIHDVGACPLIASGVFVLELVTSHSQFSARH